MPPRLPHPRNLPSPKERSHEPSMVPQTIVITVLLAARIEKSKLLPDSFCIASGSLPAGRHFSRF